MRKIIIVLSFSFLSTLSFAQANSPFTNCPNVSMAIARNGTNSYNNEPVNFFQVNTTTGVSTIISGGPIKNPANPTANIDVNGTGLNTMDGFLYGLNPTMTATPRFFRIGSDYSIEQVAILEAPVASASESVGIVNSSAGEFDLMNNYYFTALTGTVSGWGAFFTPSRFFIGKLANVSSLPAGPGRLTPVYTQLNFSNNSCTEYYSTIIATYSAGSAQNTGLRDIAYSILNGHLYTYVTFEFPAGSGIYKGQILKVDPSTGVVEGSPSAVLAFANAANEVSGTMITASGDLVLLFTNGDMYKADISSPGVYTGTISLLQTASLIGSLRGDLASCGAAVVLPVKFENFTGSSKNCALNFQWTVAQELNIKSYELEIMEKNGAFTTRKVIAATNSPLSHTYSTSCSEGSNLITARVKQTEYSGKVSYSKVLRIKTSCAGIKAISVANSGNVNNYLQVVFINSTPNEAVMLSVLRSDGALMIKQKGAAADLKIVNMQKLNKGIYFLRATFSDGTEGGQSFFKN